MGTEKNDAGCWILALLTETVGSLLVCPPKVSVGDSGCNILMMKHALSKPVLSQNPASSKGVLWKESGILLCNA